MLYGLIAFIILNISSNQRVDNQTDLSKTLHYHESFKEAIIQDRNIARAYLDSLLYLSERKNNSIALYYYHQDAGFYFFTAHNLKLSEEHYNKALEKAFELKSTRKIIDSKIWIANLKFFQLHRQKVKPLYSEILKESIEADYLNGIANGYFGLASTETNDEKAITFLLKIDSLYKVHDTISPVLSNSYNSIGEIYLNIYKNKEVAIEYFKKSHEISQQTNYISGINHFNSLLGKIALEEEKYDQAYNHFKQLLDYSIYVKDTVNQYHNLISLADIEIRLKKFNDAFLKIEKAIEYYKSIGDTVSLSNAHLTMAELELERERPSEAEKYLVFSSQHQDVLISFNHKLKLLKNKVRYFELSKNYKQALNFQKTYDSLKNILSEKRSQKSFIELEQKYRTNEKTQQIVILKAQNELKDEQQLYQRNLFIISGSALVLLSVGLFMLYRNRQKTNDKLRDLDVLKSNFFANISHEFRTPLTLILSPIQKKLSENIPEEDRKIFQQIKANNDRLLALVDQLLDLAKIEAGKLKLNVHQGDILTLIGSLADAISYDAEKKNIHYLRNIKSEDNSTYWYDSDIIQKVVLNLLINSLKYTPPNGTISLDVFVKENILYIEVKNTGEGLTKDQLNKIFERFYQSNQNAEGSGLGLSLIKELIILHKGNIEVYSIPNEWTAFKVTLPIGKNYFKKQDIVSKIDTSKYIPDEISETSHEEITEELINNEKPILLIVEDNQNVSKLLNSLFNEKYQIINAKNGKEGINKALEHIPEIIISDIMMPVKDGIELTQTLKKDERTSHIPIILLTAKAGEENELKGIETGADDYITKPFNNKILISKVDKLIQTRKELRKRYRQELILKPKEIAISDPDVYFLQKVQDILDLQLVQNSFNVDEFSKAVGISRMQLHRKIKALTGLTASEFIRDQRLRLAADLLKKSDTNVSQVAYTVGFNDHSYFTRCFRETYGSTPSEYLKEKKIH